MRTFLLPLAVLASLLATTAGAYADPTGSADILPKPTPRQRYALHAELDPRAHVVHGRALIHFVNESRAPLDHLIFHLYLNAFRDRRTVFARESHGQLRGVSKHGTGGIDVRSLSVNGEDRLPLARTDLVPGDSTQMRVPLAHPLPAGGALDVEILFDSRLPPLFARAGYVDDFHVVAQWFPKLAKLEPDGRWASFPYHGNGEFYADFADYTLTVVVPANFVVASGGDLVAERLDGSSLVQRYHAAPVHDAMFVAMPLASTRSSRCDDVSIRVVHPPGYENAAARHEHVTCEGLRFFSALYGGYPYDTLVVVVPPPGARGGAGMEYPTLFLTSGPWYSIPHVTTEIAEATTAHELAHQWFQGIVASNEVAYPFLDEGITSFVSSDFLATMSSDELDHAEAVRAGALAKAVLPPSRAAWKYTSEEYARSVYGFSELLFESVARTWGRNRLRAALGLYSRTNAFRHPVPADLYSAVDRVYYPGFSRDVLVPSLERGERPVFRVEGPRAAAGDAVVFVVKREGHDGFPTHVAVTDGRRELRRIPFPASAREVRVEVPSANRTCVIVDPDRHLLLDPHRLDDRACSRVRPAASTWFHRTLPTVQWLLGAFAP